MLNSILDRSILAFDHALRTVSGGALSARPYPAENEPAVKLSGEAATRASALMRVNHSGEVCAQALYDGQALTARNDQLRATLQNAAREEQEHLAWTEQRLHELGGHRSLLNPLWYAGSFALGALAGLAGDRWSLGFVVETEKQVEDHLTSHLDRLPSEDLRSQAIVRQMRTDEANHARLAQSAGAAELPAPMKSLMRLTAKVMTVTAYRI
jgi:3-demethoxyubiquinol 3-hydroxylase